MPQTPASGRSPTISPFLHYSVLPRSGYVPCYVYVMFQIENCVMIGHHKKGDLMNQEIIVYESDAQLRLEVRTDGETVWLTQEQPYWQYLQGEGT